MLNTMTNEVRQAEKVLKDLGLHWTNYFDLGQFLNDKRAEVQNAVEVLMNFLRTG